MSDFRFGFSLSAIVAIAIGFAEFAAAQPATPPQKPGVVTPGMQLLLNHLQVGMTLDQYRTASRNDFFQLDADANGKVEQADIDLHALMEGGRRRVQSAVAVMNFDLNGDGGVTEDEIRHMQRYNLRTALGTAGLNLTQESGRALINALQQIEATVQRFMAFDTDKDGKVTYAEASKAETQGVRQTGPGTMEARIRQLLTLDLDAKGELTYAAYVGAGDALFQKIDTDGDGKVSQDELVAFWKGPAAPDTAEQIRTRDAAIARGQAVAEIARKAGEARVPVQAGCDMPAASAKAKVILLSAYETEALSSTTIGSQDAVVHAGTITVEPGSDPLYVVIASYAPIIWQFSGAVERVERLVMSSMQSGPNSSSASDPPLVGATGLPKERIAFLARTGCFSYFSETPSSQSIQAVTQLRQALGKDPDVLKSAYSVLAFSVPSGEIQSVAKDRRGTLTIQKESGTLKIHGNLNNVIVRAGRSSARDDLFMYSPGGLIDIDPKTVVASRPVEAYEVYPQQAGLVQLLESGALTQNRSGEYIVQKKTRFPAGLHGAHSVKFLVLRGTPMPDGDPGHSCVVSEDEGKKGAGC